MRRASNALVPMSVSALARARADWLYGINITRAYTILGRKSGYPGVFSVGRLQTPALGRVGPGARQQCNFVPQHFLDGNVPLLPPA
uniref:DNA topoisomerase n=1 Tax=Salmonella enterica TaxID=28901 RepID=UPI00398C4AB6